MEALAALVAQTVSGLHQSSSGAVTASTLKRTLLRKDPTFNEADYGFRAFGELLHHLGAEGGEVVRLSAGDQTIVHDDLAIDPARARVQEVGPHRRPRRDHAVVDDVVDVADEAAAQCQETERGERRLIVAEIETVGQLVDAVETMTGSRPRSEELLRGVPVPGVEVMHSTLDAVSRAAADASVPLHADEHRLAVAFAREAKKPAEPTQSSEHLRPHRARDRRTDPLDELVAGVDALHRTQRDLYGPPRGAETAWNAAMAGAEPVLLPASRAGGFLPDLDALDHATLEATALFYLCSPANPQGAVADTAYLRRAIGLARTYDFVLAVDECYTEIYDRAPPPGAGPPGWGFPWPWRGLNHPDSGSAPPAVASCLTSRGQAVSDSSFRGGN